MDTKLSLEFRLRGLSVGLDGREVVRFVIMLNGECWKFQAGAGCCSDVRTRGGILGLGGCRGFMKRSSGFMVR